MRNVIATTANVTTIAIVNRVVRTVLAGVDATRALPRPLRLYAAPAPQHWAHASGQKPFAGKQKPAAVGSMSGGSDSSRCFSRETTHDGVSSRCRRPRVSSCFKRS
jgi:hypothetical protein